MRAAMFVALVLLPAAAANLTLTLAGDGTFKKIMARFECDRNATALGLPAGSFKIEYVNGDGNSLAVLPITGQSLVFACILRSGAKYAAGSYISWEAAGRSITLTLDTPGGKKQTSCRVVR